MNKLRHYLVSPIATAGAGLLILVAAGFFAYSYYDANATLTETRTAFASSTENYENSIRELSDKLSAKESENADLLTLLQARQQENFAYNQQLQELAATVGILDKISKTDRELLQKYSSVYFLNENYIPTNLADIDPQYLYRPETSLQVHANVKIYLEKLLAAAHADNMPLLILSGYRSFGTQAALKSGYKVTYGAGTANAFSADQGYSEHQLGSTVDFTTPKGGANLGNFENSGGYEWLEEHAHTYGFILSYPDGNRFFQYEPWHWRFVGIELAARLKNEGKHFYDLDQREINQYLSKIFD